MDLLFELTPGEYWVMGYLLRLAREQGGSPVAIPRPGGDPRLEAVFSRKHFKRLLKNLKKKAHISGVLMPRSKSKLITVYLAESLVRNIGDTHVPNVDLGDTHVPNNGRRGTPMSPIMTLGTPMSPIEPATTGVCTNLTNLQAKLKEIALASRATSTKARQGKIRQMVRELSGDEVRQMRMMVTREIKKQPKAKVSERAKLFAQIRYMQEEEKVGRPQAWLDTVAREAEEELSEGRPGPAVGLLTGREGR